MRYRLLGGLGALMLLAGCSNWGHLRNGQANVDTPRLRNTQPTADALVAYLNDNSRRITGLESRVSMDVRQGNQSGVLNGRLDCQKPRNFRLTARLVQPQVDIGSNDTEFWYWIARAEPPYVFHCSHADLARGGVRMPFPFQPDMAMTALGLSEYDPKKKYEVKVGTRTVELIEDAVSGQGQPIKKITVFARGPVSGDKPQVLAHILRDAQGQEICRAEITQVQTDETTGAIIPRRVQFSWPAEKLSLKLKLDGARVVTISPKRAETLFSRQNLAHLKSFDLARWQLDPVGQGQLQQAGGIR